MRKITTLTLLVASLFLFGCVEDNFDLAGTCVTCTTAANSPEGSIVIEACANGDGTISTVIDGGPAIESVNDLETFRVTQEGTGSSCN